MASAALVAASDFNDSHFESLWEAHTFDTVIAVDGGYEHLARLGCVPDVAIGDFDSLGYVPQDVPIMAHPVHKDESDLELALDHAQAEGVDRVYVYGAFGGRLDHSIANVQLLARYAEAGMEVCAIDPHGAIHYVVGPGTCELPPAQEGTVSVFSLVPESLGVTEKGLEYPLDDAVLTNRTTLGLSNAFTGKDASVTVQSGTLIIISSSFES